MSVWKPRYGPNRGPFSRAEHGTNSGYNLHRMAGQEACAACKEAHRVASRDQRRVRPKSP